MTAHSVRGVAVALVAAGVVGAGAALLSAPSAVRTEDRNGDGRPDVWRVYDRRGQLVERVIDSNFDGRSDILEYYATGALVRRERSRHFDDRIDLVEEFDPRTHEHFRSIVDVDEDGTADLLVLFRAGHPIYAKWAATPPGTAPHAVAGRRGPLDAPEPLANPFAADTTLDSMAVSPPIDAGVAVAVRIPLPVRPSAVDTAPAAAGEVAARGTADPSRALSRLPVPRGPPPAA
jgi:hypothetical protein